MPVISYVPVRNARGTATHVQPWQAPRPKLDPYELDRQLRGLTSRWNKPAPSNAPQPPAGFMWSGDGYWTDTLNNVHVFPDGRIWLRENYRKPGEPGVFKASTLERAFNVARFLKIARGA